jgi:hypothetical protein
MVWIETVIACICFEVPINVMLSIGKSFHKINAPYVVLLKDTLPWQGSWGRRSVAVI